ncbi:MAG: sugar ABC transporter ATP-binding protein [Bacilli bacterium]|nr:sugar ABC transporter ATP-binding protein [Bacilli bacterium]
MLSPVIELRHIHKSFPPVKVLQDVSLSFEAGQVHALVGENGAGKSTLTKILCGVLSKDEGQILYNGREVELHNVAEAHRLGIRMVYQELYLMKDLTVAQNIFIGREIKKGPFIDDKAMNKKCQELFDEYGVPLSPTALVKELTVAKMQMVEILKNISREISVLVLDEPTTALSSKEVSDLFKMIDKVKQKGVAVIYISHKMDEILTLSDQVSVLRDGVLIGTLSRLEASRDRIVSMMVGRQIESYVKKKSDLPIDAPVLLNVRAMESSFLHDISFSLRKGEILGLAGLMGSGRTEVARALFGADRVDKLDVEVHGKPVQIHSPTDAIAQGICYLSEDRKQYGLMLEHSIYANTTISSLKENTRFFLVDDAKATEEARKYKDSLSIKYSSINDPIQHLSGGNQQKCILARWLLKDAEVFLFDEPTKGIDIGAKEEIYDKIRELAKEGKAILLISSELEEILALADKVAIMAEGRMVKILDIAEANQETIMDYALRRKEE